MREVILDTNILVSVVEKKIDVVRELNELLPDGFNPVILKQCLYEVKSLDKKIASAVEKYVEANKIKVIEGAGKADEIIFDYALKTHARVVTRDYALRKRLKKAGIQVIILINSRLVFA